MTTKRRRNNKTWRKKIGAFALIITLLGTILILPTKTKTAQADNSISLFYTITFKKGEDTVHVNINIKNLLQKNFKIGFYDPGHGLRDLSKDVQNLQVSESGINSKIDYISKNTWAIQLSEQVSSIDLKYDMPRLLPCGNTFFGVATGKEFSAIFTNSGGAISGQYFFIVPLDVRVNSINVKFNLPSDWQIVCPYVKHGDYYHVPKITNNLISNFVQRKNIYFGKMKFYSEKKVGHCTVKFGILEAEHGGYLNSYLITQKNVDFYVQRTALAVEKFTEIFGDNPYPVIAMYNVCAMKDNTGKQELLFAGTGIASGCQYWPPNRFDELVGHLLYSWFCFPNKGESPITSSDFIGKGLGESYLGCKLAYDLTGDNVYLGKFYYNYLVYKRAVGTKYMSSDEIKNKYYRGGTFGLYLDNLIQKETNNSKSIYDVFGYLYKKYKNTGMQVGNKQLEEAVNTVTKQDNSAIFDKYVYGNDEIPVQDIIQPYKNAFPKFLNALQSDAWFKEYHNYAVPFIIDLEISIPLYVSKPSSHHLPFEILCNDHYRKFAAQVAENYNISKLTEKDVENVLSSMTGEDESKFFEIWKNIYPGVTLENIKDWLKSYLPYSPQNVSASVNNNSITLNWDQVKWRYLKNYYKIIGYNVYRGTEEGKEEKIATVTSNSYTDRDINIGKNYYYYITAIEDQPFRDGVHIESEPSQEIKVSTKDTTPPVITISSPEDGSETSNDSVNISGVITDDLSGVASVTLNGNSLTLNSDGSFSTTVSLTEGTNTITITATDKAGNKATKTITITYTPPVQTIIITLQPDNPYMTVNGVQQEIDPGRGTKPVIIPKWGRTVVPIRAIVEALGGTIEWDGTERKVTINFNNTTIELWIGKPQARVNGEMKWIDENNHDVKPIIVNSRTMLPLRFVAENLGCTVEWDASTRTITITYTP